MPTQALSTASRPSARTSADGAGRIDIYAGIHKALRLFLTRTLARIGSADPRDAGDVADALAMLDRLLALCEFHLKDENEIVHPAIERARPGSTARIAAEHDHHVEAFADLRDLAGLVRHGPSAARAAALARLYRALALFVADNLQHMQVEETVHNALLWSAYTDAELQQLEQVIVASVPPELMTEALHWFLPALNAPERAGMLAGMRLGLPSEAFASVLGIAARTLAPRDHARLLQDLEQPVAAQLMTS